MTEATASSDLTDPASNIGITSTGAKDGFTIIDETEEDVEDATKDHGIEEENNVMSGSTNISIVEESKEKQTSLDHWDDSEVSDILNDIKNLEDAIADSDKESAVGNIPTETETSEDVNLEESNVEDEVPEDASLPHTMETEEDEDETNDKTHPYLYLIDSFEIPKHQMTLTAVEAITGLDKSTFCLITSRVSFLRMIQNLRSQKEISIDIQTCGSGTAAIISISTKQVDYCIDAFKLRHDLLLLTEIFINPQIVKIIYKAKVILSILQQQLHLYLVNVFDINLAQSMLENKHLALTTLVKSVCGYERIIASNPDFRQRPISGSLLNFCQSSSHYLMHLHNHFKKRFLEGDGELYADFLNQCRNLCKLMHGDLRTNMLKWFTGELEKRQKCQMIVMKQLFKWAYDLTEQKNVMFDRVMSKTAFMKVVTYLPSTAHGLQAIVASPDFHSSLVKDNMHTILNIIINAHKQCQVRPLKVSILQGPPDQGQKRKFNAPHLPNKKQRLQNNLVTTSNKYPPNISNNYPISKNKMALNNPFQQSSTSSFMPPQTFIPLKSNKRPDTYMMQTSFDNPGTFSNGPEGTLYKSLINLRDARDKMRSQTRNRNPDLNIIDQKIIVLEKKLQELQRGSNRNANVPFNRRRY